MRIAFDAKRLFHNRTGLGNYSRTLVRNLLEYAPECDLHLFTPRTAQSPEIELLTQQCKVHTPTGILSGSLWRTFGMAADVAALQPDLFHGLSHELPIGLSNRGVRQVVTMHDLIFLKYPELFPYIDRKIYAAKWQHSLKTADTVVAISQCTARDVITHYGVPEHKVKVVYQSCQNAFYSALPDAEQVKQFKQQYGLPQEYILSVGSLIERKNLLMLIEAMATMPPDQRPPLIVVGEGKAYKNKLKQQIHATGLTNHVHFWAETQVDVETLRLLYAGAHASVYLSTYEGFGLPVTESLLCGTPVLASSTSSVPEAGGLGAVYVNPNDLPDVMDGLSRLLTDTTLGQKLQNEGLAYAHEQFAPAKTAQALMEVYVGRT